jgi:hypothetical protein
MHNGHRERRFVTKCRARKKRFVAGVKLTAKLKYIGDKGEKLAGLVWIEASEVYVVVR